MSFLKGGKFNKPVINENEVAPATKPSPFGKKKLGSLSKPKAEPNELDLDKQEDLTAEEPVAPAEKPKLGTKKKLGGIRLANNSDLEKAEDALSEEQTKDEIPVDLTPEQEAKIEAKEDLIAEAELCGDVITEQAEEKAKTESKKSKKKTSKKKSSEEVVEKISTVEVDESKRVSVEEMDAVMRPIVAPTTALWEQEKKDILNALDNIKVEQDMTMDQVKSALAELDDLKFEVLPKQHDAETLYDGTKQNYDTVKAIAIANGSGTNAEARKAEGILACRNYVTPSGQVVDLNQYMLLIEERNKFYQKISEGINFKKYSLVNYNNALKIEAKDL